MVIYWIVSVRSLFAGEAPVTDHLGLPGLSFCEQRVESALQVFEELLWREGACRAVEFQVVIVVPGKS